MKKRINSTGRKRLPSENIDIRLQKSPGEAHPRFSAALDMAAFNGLDKNAKVYVEPYYKTTSMRFPFGTVANTVQPEDTLLSELDIRDSILFRVKVVDESAVVGKILASAAGVRPRSDEDDGANRRALLPLVHRDLGERIWNVSLDPDSGPVLEISSKLSGLSSRLKTDPLLQGAIYPEAFRQVLRLVLDSDDTEEDSWSTRWRTFLKTLTGIEELDFTDDGEEESAFIDDAVSAFCKAHTFRTRAGLLEESAA